MFRNTLASKISRSFSQQSYKPKSNSSNLWFLGVGCGTIGFALGLKYNDVSEVFAKQKEKVPASENTIENIGSVKKTKEKRKFIKGIPMKEAIATSRMSVERTKATFGIPGMVIAVSVDGKIAWAEGFGFSDVENNVQCHKNTVMRIASISKSLTMTAAAKLWENGKLDMDKSILEYLPDYPQPQYQDSKVVITPRQLASHLSGIRHYSKTLSTKKQTDGELVEFYSKEHFENVKDALKIFQSDPLLYKPGQKYLYTTHGYTVLSAVIEAVAKEPYNLHLTKMFKDLGMNNTYLDINDVLVPNRTRYYYFNKNGKITNSPYVDNSNKWAGGGIQSTVGDLLRFGNVMLYSAQQKQPDPNSLPGYLKPDTILKLWEPVVNEDSTGERKYGMGWAIIPQEQKYGCGGVRRFIAGHSGGAVGASSMLLIMPRICSDDFGKVNVDCQWEKKPCGVVVAILVNLQGIPLQKLASVIAENFENVKF